MVLAERFGGKRTSQLERDVLALHFLGADGDIVFDRLDECSTRVGSGLHFQTWDAENKSKSGLIESFTGNERTQKHFERHGLEMSGG
jgi:hypothetical protein